MRKRLAEYDKPFLFALNIGERRKIINVVFKLCPVKQIAENQSGNEDKIAD